MAYINGIKYVTREEVNRRRAEVLAFDFNPTKSEVFYMWKKKIYLAIARWALSNVPDREIIKVDDRVYQLISNIKESDLRLCTLEAILEDKGRNL